MSTVRINPILRISIILVTALVVWFLRSLPNTPASSQAASNRTVSGQAASSQTTPTQITSSLIVKNQTIYDLNGRVAYQGDIDLRPVFERIQNGQRDDHRNDGVVHRNREGKLPRQGDPEYYREYVVRTPGLRSVGPQRLIIGKGGEAYYTPDHYQSFIRVK
jgi:ribonuclease T1